MDAVKTRFLIVDDDRNIRKLCSTIGASLGYACLEAESPQEALQLLESEGPELVLADLMLPESAGLEVLERAKAVRPHCEVSIMTAHGSIEVAVQAMRLGAFDFLSKPFRVEEMKMLLKRMEEKVNLVAENQFLRDRVSTEHELSGIIGTSAKIQDVLRTVGRLRDTRTPVLITGESGTGKELVARAIHYRGSMAARPFVAVDCGSLVPTLIESELFGYEKGAFTGAVKSKEGLFQAASGGTIFLDEIGELPLDMQAKLLRVLQEKEVRPVGSNRSIKVDVRVIAATNRDLERAIQVDTMRDQLVDARARAAAAEGDERKRASVEAEKLQAELDKASKITFRQDLFFRLNVVRIHVPSLRERKADIPALVRWFLEKYAGGQKLEISSGAMNLLMQYEWPGNVRELENCVERAVALGADGVLDVNDLPPVVVESVPGRAPVTPVMHAEPIGSDLEEMERSTILRVFDQVRGDKELAGKMLGISRATLYRKLKRYNIAVPRKLSHTA